MKFVPFIVILIWIGIVGCKPKQAVFIPVEHPEWCKNSIIYEVNVRQFTPDGTFKSMQAHLPRLKELGVDILWFMPIHKIGVEDRKGKLGSYYSVQDYTSINPEFGTMKDFKAAVDEAHRLGFKVIIDWVANHTSRDAVWIKEHPDWYVHDSTGRIVGPYDWTDVAKLNYGNANMRKAMIDAMEYWLVNANIDGFRCDVAGEVPTDFWNNARMQLQKIKPVFMLAEWENPALLKYAFDMDYAWELHRIMNQIAQGKLNVNTLVRYYKKQDTLYSANDIRMIFTSNHDENSWNGTEFERMGEAARTFAAYSYITPGMPLIYNGQEVALNKRLAFFTKDTITWTENVTYTNLYKKLNALKHDNSALWNGNYGGTFQYSADSLKNVITITRTKDASTVVGIFNLSSKATTAKTPTFAAEDYITGDAYEPNQGNFFKTLAIFNI